MKVCMLFIIFLPSLTTKEYSEDISHLLHNPDLLLELVKRLGNNKASPVHRKKSITDEHYKGSHVPVHGDLRTCKTHLSTKRIIKTADSKKLGASFLGSEENVDTNDKCLKKCCSLPGCDLAVYENKKKHNCYMFKCHNDETGGSNCIFGDHADYLSTILSNFEDDIGHTASVADNKDTEYEDSLGVDPEKVTKKLMPASSDTKPPLPTQLPHSVALGQMCQLDLSCEDPHTVCFKSTCRCQQRYYQKHGFCREVCLRDQVECKGRGTARVGPDCIPKSQVCDGMTQCADGSDEKECKAGYQDGGPNPHYTQSHGNWDDRSNQLEGDVLSGTPDNFMIDDKGTSKSTENIDTVGPSDPVTNENTDNKNVANENTGNKQTVDKNTESGAPKPLNMNKENKENSPHEDFAKHKATENISGNSLESVPMEVNTTPQSVQHVEVVNKAEETVFLTKEKVIVASPTDSAQGPIVALSLGLAITLMLLVFVGCRLRNVRHRLRKGRPLHSNEADYLINGMYL